MTTSRRELLPGTVAVAGIPGSFAGAGPRLPMRPLGTTRERVSILARWPGSSATTWPGPAWHRPVAAFLMPVATLLMPVATLLKEVQQ